MLSHFFQPKAMTEPVKSWFAHTSNQDRSLQMVLMKGKQHPPCTGPWKQGKWSAPSTLIHFVQDHENGASDLHHPHSSTLYRTMKTGQVICTIHTHPLCTGPWKQGKWSAPSTLIHFVQDHKNRVSDLHYPHSSTGIMQLHLTMMMMMSVELQSAQYPCTSHAHSTVMLSKRDTAKSKPHGDR